MKEQSYYVFQTKFQKYSIYCIFKREQKKAAWFWNMNVISTKTQLFLVYDKGVNNPLIWQQGTCLTNRLCISGPWTLIIFPQLKFMVS